MSLEALGPDTLRPDAAEGETFPLHPRAFAVWLGQSLAALAAVAIPVAISIALTGRWLLLAFVPIAWLLLAGAAAAYGRAYFRRFQCRLLADGLLIERGVWWRSETFVPRSRIQHTDIEVGPLQRQLGMATLEVYTAGTHASRLAVPGLGRDAALRLRDRLLGRGGHDAL